MVTRYSFAMFAVTARISRPKGFFTRNVVKWFEIQMAHRYLGIGWCHYRESSTRNKCRAHDRFHILFQDFFVSEEPVNLIPSPMPRIPQFELRIRGSNHSNVNISTATVTTAVQLQTHPSPQPSAFVVTVYHVTAWRKAQHSKITTGVRRKGKNTRWLRCRREKWVHCELSLWMLMRSRSALKKPFLEFLLGNRRVFDWPKWWLVYAISSRRRGKYVGKRHCSI